ncbi:hypothetical protein L2E82_53557 [Cichorium intybus]|nr:hypothetical protein L2E82_53557 [Cichorium intybus]
MMQGIIDLHHDIFFFLILILVFVSRILVRALWHFQKEKNPIPQRIVHGTTIEILRTIFPSIIPMFIAIPSFALLYSMDEVVVNPAITIKAIGHQWYRSAPLHEGDLSATKCLKNMVREASGLPTPKCSQHRSLWFHLVVAGAVAYNFGPNGRPSNLSEWGIPVGNNHGSSCGTTGPGEDNLLFLLLFLRFGDGGPTVARVGGGTCWHNASWNVGIRVGVESFLRGNLQVQFGGRRASTQPYEYSDYNSSDEQSLTFDSYTIPEDDLELGQLRLLEVDNRVVVPAKSHLRIIVTSADVLHSWAVPSSGVKCDAVPGRLNQTSISVQREGVYYGQCSEICGTNHAFMRAPGKIGRLLSPLWLSRTTQGASHPRSKLLQRAAGAVWSRGARQ